jgi:hypothetical protein
MTIGRFKILKIGNQMVSKKTAKPRTEKNPQPEILNMKTSILALFSAASISQAAIVQFELSPPGTDAAVGLSPLNETGGVTNSTGSGGLISAGILFDTDTARLGVTIGYGSAAGFTDLTGPATAAHIHGPASTGATANVVIDLAPYLFPAANPTNGGVIFGTIQVPTNLVADLLGGSNYVNIHTALNPGGEIRGQLIPLIDQPPTVVCPPPATVECGVPVTVTVNVGDAEGDALTVVWNVNGTSVQTNSVPAAGPPTAASVPLVTNLPLGTNVIQVTVTDGAGNSAACATTVTVVDTVPPTITSVKANPTVLWPPNHKMVRVNLSVVAHDTCSLTTWKIIAVSSNEATNGLGDGDTPNDWEIIGDHGLNLRAERSGKGNGRVYTVTVQAVDTSGNLSTPKTVTVTVPKSQGKGGSKK